MKKWITGILICVFVLVASLYVFIPNNIALRKSVIVHISRQAISRLLIDNSEWNKGWPGDADTARVTDTGQSLNFNGYSYTAIDRKYGSLILAIHRGNDTISTSSLNIITISKDSVKLDWEAMIPASKDPGKRLQLYLASKKINNDMGALLKKMENYFSKPGNVYGIDIRQESVVDSTLLLIYDSSKGYPSTAMIYSLIEKLTKYTISQDATVTGYPMLNIYTKDSIVYLTKVALPVNKKLPTNGNISYKWMLPGGNILVTDVKGGPKSIDSAFKQMDHFIEDYDRHAPAIPFFSLITDRMKEKDSTQWVTRIYYPVMN